MDGTFDNEAEPVVTIREYLEEVEEREVVSHFLHPCYIRILFSVSLRLVIRCNFFVPRLVYKVVSNFNF